MLLRLIYSASKKTRLSGIFPSERESEMTGSDRTQRAIQYVPFINDSIYISACEARVREVRGYTVCPLYERFDSIYVGFVCVPRVLQVHENTVEFRVSYLLFISEA